MVTRTAWLGLVAYALMIQMSRSVRPGTRLEYAMCARSGDQSGSPAPESLSQTVKGGPGLLGGEVRLAENLNRPRRSWFNWPKLAKDSTTMESPLGFQEGFT